MDEWPDFDVAEVFLKLAQDIGQQPDVRATQQRIVELLHKTTGCSGAAIWHLTPHGRLVADAATNPDLIAGVQPMLDDAGEGICWQCLRDRKVVRSNDFGEEPRWPRYTQFVLTNTSVRSALGLPLGLDDRPLGSLSLYADEPRFFTGRRVQAATLLAAHASLALEAAYDADRVRNLETALASNRRIGIAIGVLMASRKVTEEQAFALLRTTSQHNHLKLAEIAEYVVETGEVPVWQPVEVQDQAAQPERSNR